jgi:hypothetical protein
MKKYMVFGKYIWLSLFLIVLHLQLSAQESDLYNQIKSFPEVKSIQKITQNPFFKESYEILIDQYLDHKNPAAGKFTQRIILSDFNKYSPVIFVTEGYSADYALKPTYINELSRILDANQIIVEHRYFGKSMPNSPNWDYLTIENECADLHQILKIFKRIYNNQNKWIATGISKGGHNTLAYKAFYPNDADIWIPYVAPVNFGVEDGRHEKFLDNVGSAACRNKIEEFQKEILMKRDSVQPLLDSLIQANKYTFRINKDEVLDYCVLEYKFAFWQWGTNCADIPVSTDNIHNKFEHLIKICNPDYFSIEGIEPIKAFFIQAAKEIGYYGYDVKPLIPYLKIKDAEGYLNEIFLPENTSFKFSKKTSKFIEKSLQKNGNYVLLIYGEYDPWTASGLVVKPSSTATKIVIPKGSHKSRIATMQYKQKADIYMLLETWLSED